MKTIGMNKSIDEAIKDALLLFAEKSNLQIYLKESEEKSIIALITNETVDKDCAPGISLKEFLENNLSIINNEIFQYINFVKEMEEKNKPNMAKW